ncbi:MAG: heat-inducible transcriptional repressor HrcA [Oscillospiraceae bacterium]|jgi:heat-inducible transcriptional repressor|nr:heat-inducible transcriptional repressor HrcA [Oscillospiraceae bacterium]
MELSQRQKIILAAIVENFIQTGEPVGSKLLSRQLDINVSPATIRSDMATLFELGYLEQPHTSAGRVPSHLGYREYIDSLMQCQPLTQEERDQIDSLFNVRDPDPDKLLEDAADALSDYTGCASITSSITAKAVRVRRIELIAAGANTVVILLIASNGVIKNKVCRVDFTVTPELIEFFMKFANSRLAGRNIQTITTTYINSVSVTLGEYSRIFTPLLVGIFELCKEVSEGQYYIGGGAKLLEYDELGRLARDLLIMLDNKERLHSIFDAQSEDLKIRIGKENANLELVGSSLVVTHYEISGERAGTVGLIGPVRIDYAKIIPHLDYFAKTLGRLLSDTLEGE